MRRFLLASVFASTCLLVSNVSWANHLLNAELSGGVGVTAYNLATDSKLAPPFVQLQVSYLPLEIGPVSMGPLLGLPIGFYSAETEEDTEDSNASPKFVDRTHTQIGVRVGWQVFGRPNVHFAWNATVAFDFVMSPLYDEDDPLDFVWGLELGGGAAYFLTAGFALTAGFRYAMFYGVDAAHVFSGNVGLMISYEVLR